MDIKFIIEAMTAVRNNCESLPASDELKTEMEKKLSICYGMLAKVQQQIREMERMERELSIKNHK